MPRRRRTDSSGGSSSSEENSASDWEQQNDDAAASSRRSSEFEEDGLPEGDDEPSDNESSSVDRRPPPTKKPRSSLLLLSSSSWRGGAGHAHSLESRRKIGLANKGNTPWNKGQTRSNADKAKISAGVKAHNRLLFSQKAQACQMTVDDYAAKKKKVNRQREKLRKLQQQVAELETTSSSMDVVVGNVDEAPEEEEEYPPETAHEATDRSETSPHEAIRSTRFAKDFVWEPPIHANVVACPMHGPGGLICCATCTAQYSQYMSQTLASLETQRFQLIAQQTKELAGLLTATKSQLDRTVRQARRKPFPLRK